MARPKEFDTTEALDLAVEVFWEHGYEATSMTDLLSAMRISRQSCYDTFGPKHDLFLQALERFVDTRVSEALGPLASPEASLADLRVHLEQMARTLSGPAGCRACMVANSAMELAPHDPEVAAIVERTHLRVEQALFLMLRNARTAGDLEASAKPRRLARFLAATMQGMLVRAKSGASAAELRDIAKATIEALPGRTT
jgi:TetR/AcrR family transcriptional repressor of nem operon